MSHLLLDSEWIEEPALAGIEEVALETDPWAAHAAARKAAPADCRAIPNLEMWLDLSA